jgi:hypothetical protein
MAYDEQRITTHYGGGPIISDWQTLPQDREVITVHDQGMLQEASREAAQREMAYLAALSGRPRIAAPPLPSLKEPQLPDDFKARLEALDDEIYERGIAVSRERLLSVGKERFQELLVLDRAARFLQRVIGTATDLTSWPSVWSAFASVNALVTPIKPRTDSERLTGAGKERETATRIDGFSDLWKANQEPASVRAVYAFHDAFVSLMFGQSMLELIGSDGRMHAEVCCGGRGVKVRCFNDWLSALNGSHFQVTLERPLWYLVAWLANETAPFPNRVDLARQWFNVRSPSHSQIKLAQAVVEGFLLGYSEWGLGDYVGSLTRQLLGQEQLETWRTELSRRYPAIQAFSSELRAAFYRNVSIDGYSSLALDGQAYRVFVNRSVRNLRDQLSGVLALAIDETQPKACVARFHDSALVEAKQLKAKLSERISANLAAAFPGSTFDVNIKEVA